MKLRVQRAFPTMNRDEIGSLFAFCRVCNALAVSPFGGQFKVAFCKAYRVQPNTIHSTLVKKFDIDLFRSFLIDFRKLILAKEPANIFRVLSILSRYGNTTDRDRVRQIKSEIRNVSESAHCGIGDLDGAFRQVKPKEMTDAYFNGVLFHNDEDRANEIAFFREAGIMACHAMFHYVVFIYKQASRLAGSIRLRGIV